MLCGGGKTEGGAAGKNVEEPLDYEPSDYEPSDFDAKNHQILSGEPSDFDAKNHQILSGEPSDFALRTIRF
ncbi:hypothetical protein [Neisseria gonorrhoeae]|uniref:hypothetical protein n=1 Tax=Neisseria gonorrhoeae TaxID=485 RepID=UPI00387B178C